MKNLNDILPVYAIENNAILSKMGDVTVVFEVQLPELFTMSNDEYEAFHHAWIKAIKVLPVNTVLHKQDWFTEAKYKPSFVQEDNSFLTRSSDRFFNERPYLDHRCYIMLTKKPANRKNASSIFSSLLRRTIVPEETLQPKHFHDFMNHVGQFQKILTDSGFISMRQIENNSLADSILHYLNLGNDSVLLRDIEFKPEWKIGENHCQLYTMADAEFVPALCGSRINYDRYSTDKTKFSVGFASPIGQLLSCNHIYNQYVFIEDVQKTMQKLESKRLRLQSLSAYSRENAISKQATDDFLNEAISEQRLPVKAHFNLLAWTDNKEELKNIRNLCSSALTQMDATPKLETEGSAQIYWAGIPGNAADFPMNDTFDTFSPQACCFFNLETNYRSSVSPIGIRLGDRLSGKPIHVDISDEPMDKGICTNRNKFILGPSGSGKSFFTNHMVRSYYEKGTHIVLVDVGHSYKGLCDMVNGYYFTYSETKPIKFNPFYIGEGDILDTEKKESIKTLLLALWKKDNETFNRSEYVALSNALQLYFEKVENDTNIFPCFDSFYDFLKEEFVIVLKGDNVKDKDFDVSNFLYVLRPYYKGGEFDYLLNAKENLDLLQQRFIVFELDNIKDHPILFPVVTIIIMEVFISKMRKLKGIRKMILIEEAWKAIAKEGMAEYIKYLFKTVRKFFGEAIVVTQEVEDIISSPVVKQAIINNSDCKILLDQSKYQNKFDQIQELLGLTEKEKALVLSINKANDPTKKYKEVFISLGGVLSKVYRTEVSPEEYLAYTTEEKEKVKVQAYAAKFGGDIEKGIKALADEIIHFKN
ncbi:MAG: TraG family conjugative transposon ATPase [Sediminibacterium sp.]|jgi:conjugation system TraG family ATPase|uniref:TraG family conjugative transposon ATPase n=2 Tax=Pseudomonadati TaxID=3379134 RepID=UPI00047D5CFD|nr:TraG family conjugative transposon ATPase [Asinibacterium sp. OR53]MBR2647964.1 TraG family conjugative transposon ATPase [Sediminibacterium sp.]MCA6438989.1 TraG family conjugative transposon ATPase [Chitinophagaceae bacterium]MCA6446318.1 TraG family conjugative transposon ATPase [Chitinophagaceae bacterium]